MCPGSKFQQQYYSNFVPLHSAPLTCRLAIRDLQAAVVHVVQPDFILLCAANISLDRDQWARDFPPNGTAVIGSASGNVFTITSDLQPPPSLGLGQITGFMRVDPGATLNISNIKLEDIALNHEYAPTQSQPYRNVGPGYGLWPTLQLANNATVSHHHCCGLGHRIITAPAYQQLACLVLCVDLNRSFVGSF